MRSVRLLRNIATNWMRQVLSGVLGFIITPILVHSLGAAQNGLWVMVFSLTGYFGLFDQGIRPSLVRYLSRDHALDDTDGMSRTMSSALVLYGAVGVVVMAATLFAAVHLDWLHGLTADQVALSRPVVMIAGASIALGLPLGVFGAALSGLQRYDLANWVGMGIALLRTAGFILVLRLGGGLIGLAWMSLAVNLLGHVLSMVLVRRLIPGLRFTRTIVDSEHLRRIGSYSGIAFLGALATSIAFQTDSVVIAGFLGAAAVTPFALAASLVEAVRTMVYGATWVLSPTASELETRGEMEKLRAMVLAGTKYTALLCWPVLAGLLIFGRNLLTVWVDPKYASAYPVLVALTVPTFISLPQSVAGSVLYGVSRHRGVVALAVANALFNLGLSLWWVRSMGLLGVALGTAVPLLLIQGVATAVYTARTLQLPAGRYLRDTVLVPALATLGFVIPAVVIQGLAPPHTWIGLFLASAGSWLGFAALAWVLAVDDRDRVRWGRMLRGLMGQPMTPPAGAELR